MEEQQQEGPTGPAGPVLASPVASDTGSRRRPLHPHRHTAANPSCADERLSSPRHSISTSRRGDEATIAVSRAWSVVCFLSPCLPISRRRAKAAYIAGEAASPSCGSFGTAYGRSSTYCLLGGVPRVTREPDHVPFHLDAQHPRPWLLPAVQAEQPTARSYANPAQGDLESSQPFNMPIRRQSAVDLGAEYREHESQAPDHWHMCSEASRAKMRVSVHSPLLNQSWT